MRTRGRIRLLLAAGFLVLTSAPGVAGIAGIAAADSPGPAGNTNQFNLSSEADAVETVVSDNSIPLVQTVQTSPDGASSTLSSIGVSDADAGAPYEPFVNSLPSTITGLGGGNVPPIPAIPGYTTSDYPGTPASSESTGGYELQASSSPTDSKGQVTLGTHPAGSQNSNGFATSESTANADGSVKVFGTAGYDAFSFGGLLDLGNVSSTFTMTEQLGRRPVITGSTDLGTVTLLSSAGSGVQNGGLLVAGVATPVTPASLSAVNTALAASGISITSIPQTFVYTDGTSSVGNTPENSKTVESVDSGGLQIAADEADTPTQGATTTTITIGRVFLSADISPGFDAVTSGGDSTGDGLPALPAPAGSPAPGTDSPGTDSPGTDAPGTGTAPAGAAPSADSVTAQPAAGVVPVASDTGGAAGLTTDVAVGNRTSGGPTVAPPVLSAARQQETGGTAAAAPEFRLATRVRPTSLSFYLILALAAVAALISSQLIRIVSVRQLFSPR